MSSRRARSRRKTHEPPEGRHEGVPLPPPPDPLYRDVNLGHSVTLAVLGVPVRFSSNSAAALDAVDESFGMRAAPVPSGSPTRDPIQVRLILHQGDERSDGPVPLVFRMPDARRILVQSPGSVGLADLLRRDAFVYLTPRLLDDRGRFRRSVIETLTLTLVNAEDRHPVHAAALVRGDAVLLLAGKSGCGKSTLVYAAMRAGFAILADDVTYLQLEPQLRIWGMPGWMYLTPEAREHFPEIAGLEATLLANGKTKLVVTVPPDRLAAVPVAARRVGVALLRPSHGPVGLEKAGAREIDVSLSGELDNVSRLVGASMRTAVERLAAPGGWRLTLSPRPAEALPLLERIFHELSAET